MKNSIILFLFLIPTFLFAQYPTTGNKSRLGWQTTGDGLIWRGVAGDTVNKPNNRNYPYFQLDTVNAVLYHYIATQGQWQEVGGGVDIDSLIYATRFWVNSNFFPLQGGRLTGTAGAGFVGFPAQSFIPSIPPNGFSIFGDNTGHLSWIKSDGYIRTLISPLSAVDRAYTFMNRSYTLADSADVAALPTGSGTTNYYAKWSGTNALSIGNLFDNNTVVSILNSKPFSLGQWTTAGRPAGTTGYTGYNTTVNYQEFYDGSTWFPTAFWAKSGTTLSWGSGSVLAGATSYTGTAPRLYVEQPNDNFVAEFRNTASVAFAPYSLMKMSRATNTVGYGGVFSFDFQNSSSTFVNYARFGALIESNTAGSENGALAFYTTRTGATIQERLRIHSDGNVSIGNTTSASSLDVFRTTNALNMVRVGTSSNGNAAYARFRVQASSNASNYADFGKYSSGVSAYKIISPSDLLMYNGSIAGDFAFLNDYAGGKIKFSAGGSSTAQLTLATTGNFLIGTTTDVTDYLLNMVGTGAMSLPRGTVAQRPTIASSTTPFRYNTDSTALEYGESVGTWRQIATRAYARTMKDGNGIYGGSGSLVGSTTITSGNANVDWDNVSGFTLISGGATGATSITSDVYNSTKQYVNLAKSKYIQRYQTFDSRALTVSANPNFVDVFEWNTTGSTQYEWGNATILDTTNSIFTYKQGGRYFAAFHQFVGNRPTSGTVARLVPLFDFNQSLTGNGVAWSPFVTFRAGTDTLLQVKKNGVLEAKHYGSLSNTAAALSKTGTNINATFATDGTILEIERKRDTTIYVDDADYDWSAAITTAQIASRYNRVIFWMTTTAAAGSDSELTLHTPDANLLQVEYLIHSVDEPAGFDNKIVFGTNNAVDSTNGLVTNYYPAAGDGIHIRAGLRSGVYKYRYSN